MNLKTYENSFLRINIYPFLIYRLWKYIQYFINCTIHFSAENILREISKDKGEKYPDGDVDLFIFVTDEEFRLMKELIPQRTWNGTASGFLNQILKSPFPKIYVCEWCFERQEYNTDNPQLIIFIKYGDGLK